MFDEDVFDKDYEELVDEDNNSELCIIYSNGQGPQIVASEAVQKITSGEALRMLVSKEVYRLNYEVNRRNDVYISPWGDLV